MPGDTRTRRRRFLALAAVSAIAVAVTLPASGADSPSSLRERAGQLNADNAALAARSRAAVLTLYGLDAQLAQARSRLTSLRAQAAAVERRRADARRQLRIVQRLVTASQRNLANRLRAAYEQGDTDPLAIILGADSIDDALAGIETVNATAASDRRLVAQARRARAAYIALQRRLAARAAKLRRLQASVAATADALAAAKVERAAYIQRLASERRLNAAQIGSLESRAQAIEAQAQQVAIQQTAAAPTAPVAPPVATGARTMTVVATAYTLTGQTATGAPVGYGVVAVDPNVIPLGTRMTIPGYGEGIAADTGGAIQGAVIDLWFPTAAQAAAWGRRVVTITLH